MCAWESVHVCALQWGPLAVSSQKPLSLPCFQRQSISFLLEARQAGQ